MLLSHIKQLLDETISPEQFGEAISAELTEYKTVYKKDYTEITVFLQEDIYFLFTESHYNYLETLYRSPALKDYELSYICDALMLSEMTLYENDSLPGKIEHLQYNH